MGEKAQVLVIDDDASVAITLQAVLEREGFSVWVAKSKSEAIALIESNAFNVALVDLRLGEANGIRLLEIFRTQQPECMPIMLTGYASLESAVEAIRQGAYDYLIKPCDIEELKLTVKSAAERSAMASQVRKRLEEQESDLTRLGVLVQELRQSLDGIATALEQRTQELEQVKRQIQQP